jgi:hypothetical protein
MAPVALDNDLAIAFGPEPVAKRGQLAPQLDIVENLAVEGKPDATVLAGQRLGASCSVDKAQPRVAQANVVVAI